MLQWSAYSYWRDLPVAGMATVVRPDRGWAAIPTNDGLTLLVVGWPAAEEQAYKTDVEANYPAPIGAASEFKHGLLVTLPPEPTRPRQKMGQLPDETHRGRFVQ
ncbi:MAG: hypothetical protein ACRD29_13850 [Acidimicrobiales bacterium]